MSETITAVVLGAFALITLVLVQARQLMREIVRTVEVWRRMKQTLRGQRQRSESKGEPDIPGPEQD